MNKKFAAVGMISILLSFTLTTCSSSPAGAVEQLKIDNSTSFMDLLNQKSEPTMLEKIAIEAEADKKRIEKEQLVLYKNTTKVNKAIDSLMSHVGKTWYVFSGSTPSGWDCSGLVMWTYSQIGIELYHGASAQKNSGKFVSEKDAKPGDIVSFGWTGYSGAGHVGIYVGNGKMIHVGKPGESTSVINVEDFSRGYSKIKYTRLIETN